MICAHCEAPKLRRLIGTGGAIIFKGAGFYETDYKQKKRKTEKPSTDTPAAAPEKTCSSAPKKNDYGSRE